VTGGNGDRRASSRISEFGERRTFRRPLAPRRRAAETRVRPHRCARTARPGRLASPGRTERSAMSGSHCMRPVMPSFGHSLGTGSATGCGRTRSSW
jgi:hypothetical protein